MTEIIWLDSHPPPRPIVSTRNKLSEAITLTRPTISCTMSTGFWCSVVVPPIAPAPDGLVPARCWAPALLAKRARMEGIASWLPMAGAGDLRTCPAPDKDDVLPVTELTLAAGLGVAWLDFMTASSTLVSINNQRDQCHGPEFKQSLKTCSTRLQTRLLPRNSSLSLCTSSAKAALAVTSPSSIACLSSATLYFLSSS